MTTADMRLAAIHYQEGNWKTEDLENMIEAHSLVIAFLEELRGFGLAVTPLRKQYEELHNTYMQRKAK